MNVKSLRRYIGEVLSDESKVAIVGQKLMFFDGPVSFAELNFATGVWTKRIVVDGASHEVSEEVEKCQQ